MTTLQRAWVDPPQAVQHVRKQDSQATTRRDPRASRRSSQASRPDDPLSPAPAAASTQSKRDVSVPIAAIPPHSVPRRE